MKCSQTVYCYYYYYYYLFRWEIYCMANFHEHGYFVSGSTLQFVFLCEIQTYNVHELSHVWNPHVSTFHSFKVCSPSWLWNSKKKSTIKYFPLWYGSLLHTTVSDCVTAKAKVKSLLLYYKHSCFPLLFYFDLGGSLDEHGKFWCTTLPYQYHPGILCTCSVCWWRWGAIDSGCCRGLGIVWRFH